MRVAIGFDFDHTLAIDNKLERTALMDLAKELGVTIGENDVARFAQIDTLLQEMRMDKLALDQMVARFVHSLGKDHMKPGLTERFKQICYTLVPRHIVALPGVPELFAALRERGVPYGILTNGWSALQERKADAIRFDGPVLVSAVIGVSKPSPQAFAYLRDLFPPGTRVWYVGDNPATDVRGALDAGMEGIWYHEYAGVAYPTHLPAPSAVIDGLLDILPLLQHADSEGKPGRLEAMPKLS